jgi:hypothetical protein
MTEGVYRDPIGAREERIADLNRALVKSEAELTDLAIETEGLNAAYQTFLTPHAVALSGVYRAGRALGVVIMFTVGIAVAARTLVSTFHL